MNSIEGRTHAALSWHDPSNILQWIYEQIPSTGIDSENPLVTEGRNDWYNIGKVVAFDQTEFASSGSNLSKYGAVYIPDHCVTNADCKVVFKLHGCWMHISDYLNNMFGYTQIAAWNNIILVLP